MKMVIFHSHVNLPEGTESVGVFLSTILGVMIPNDMFFFWWDETTSQRWVRYVFANWEAALVCWSPYSFRDSLWFSTAVDTESLEMEASNFQHIYILIYNLLSGIEMAFWYPNRECIRYVWEHLFIRFRTKIQVHVPHICQHWFRHTWHRVMALNSYKWDYSSCN